jgi:hypothetical protein
LMMLVPSYLLLFQSSEDLTLHPSCRPWLGKDATPKTVLVPNLPRAHINFMTWCRARMTET